MFRLKARPNYFQWDFSVMSSIACYDSEKTLVTANLKNPRL